MSAERAIGPRFSIENLSLEFFSAMSAGPGKCVETPGESASRQVECEWNDSFPGELRLVERVNRRATDSEERTGWVRKG